KEVGSARGFGTSLALGRCVEAVRLRRDRGCEPQPYPPRRRGLGRRSPMGSGSNVPRVSPGRNPPPLVWFHFLLPFPPSRCVPRSSTPPPPPRRGPVFYTPIRRAGRFCGLPSSTRLLRPLPLELPIKRAFAGVHTVRVFGRANFGPNGRCVQLIPDAGLR